MLVVIFYINADFYVEQDNITEGYRNLVFESNDDDEDGEGEEDYIDTSEYFATDEEYKKLVYSSLYEATRNGSYQDIVSILRNKGIKVTDGIAINGNTALHLAVSNSRDPAFLEQVLALEDYPNRLSHLQNSAGSTVLHVAAIVDNIEACKILVRLNPELLFIRDKEDDTPLNKAISARHTDTFLYLLNPHPDIEMGRLFQSSSGDELLVILISSKKFGKSISASYSSIFRLANKSELSSVYFVFYFFIIIIIIVIIAALALKMSEKYTRLHSDAVLMAIAQNFPSEPQLNFWETTVRKCTLMLLS